MNFVPLYRQAIWERSEQLRGYASTVSTALLAESNRFSNELDKLTEGFDDYTAQDVRELFEDEAWNVSEYFPTLFRNSTFCNVYLWFETTLVSICKHDRIRSGRRFNGREHSKMLACQRYLNACFGSEFPDQHPDWRIADDYYKTIRNCITHSDALLTMATPGVNQFLIRKGCLDTSGKVKRIKLTHEFCLESLETVQRLLNSVLDKIDPPSGSSPIAAFRA